MAVQRPQEPGEGRGRHVILYDGVCGLCNRINAFVLPRDADGASAFAALQSDVARELLRRFGKTPDDLSTFYVVANHESASAELLSKSRAALFVLKTLGGVWASLAILRVLPAALLDAAYDAIARNRYRLFGRYESCLVPTPEYRSRFLDAS